MNIILQNRLVSDNLYDLLNTLPEHISVEYETNCKIIVKQNDSIISYPYWNSDSATSDFNELIRVINIIQNTL